MPSCWYCCLVAGTLMLCHTAIPEVIGRPPAAQSSTCHSSTLLLGYHHDQTGKCRQEASKSYPSLPVGGSTPLDRKQQACDSTLQGQEKAGSDKNGSITPVLLAYAVGVTMKIDLFTVVRPSTPNENDSLYRLSFARQCEGMSNASSSMHV